MGLLFLFGAFLAVGMFFLAASILKLPTLGTAKAMLNTGRQEKKAAQTLEAYLMTIAARLAGHIRMDEYKRTRMANVLNATGMGMTPEVYQAYAMVKAGADIVNITLHFFLKDVRPMLPLVMKYNTSSS